MEEFGQKLPAHVAKKVEKIEDVDAIIAFLRGTDNTDLSEKRKELLIRYDFIDNQIRAMIRESQIVKIIQKKFEISPATAYRSIGETKRVFASISRNDKEYYRRVAIEWSLDALRMAQEAKDLKGFNAALRNFYVITGLNKEVVDMPDFEKLVQHNYQINLPPSANEFLQKLMQGGAINFSEVKPPNAVTLDISHEEVKNE